MHLSTEQAPQHSAELGLEMTMGSQGSLVCHHRGGLCQGRLPGLGTVPIVSCWHYSDLRINSALRDFKLPRQSQQLLDGSHWPLQCNRCCRCKTSVVRWLFVIGIQPRPRLATGTYRATQVSSVRKLFDHSVPPAAAFSVEHA